MLWVRRDPINSYVRSNKGATVPNRLNRFDFQTGAEKNRINTYIGILIKRSDIFDKSVNKNTVLLKFWWNSFSHSPDNMKLNVSL